MNLFGKKRSKPSQQAYAVVTGAGSGIGRSFALELGARGGGQPVVAEKDQQSWELPPYGGRSVARRLK